MALQHLQLALAILLLTISCGHSLVSLQVDLVTDTPANGANCYPSPVAGQCNLRSAWDVCTSLSYEKCIVHLDASNGIHEVDLESYGYILMRGYHNISLLAEGETTVVSSLARASNFIVMYEVGSDVGFLEVSNILFLNFGYDSYGSVLYGYGNFDIVVNGGMFAFNMAIEGGSCYFANNELGKIHINSSYFYQNSASNGGSISVQNSWHVVIQDSYFEEDYVTGRGGSIYFSINVHGAQIINCHFENTKSEYYGGAFVLEEANNDVIVANSVFKYVQGYRNGGVGRLGADNLRFVMRNCQVYNAYSDHGAVLYLYDGNDYSTVEDCNFIGNNGFGTGGSIRYYIANEHATLERITIECSDSRIPVWGGGVSVYKDNHYMLISNSTIKGCKAQGGGGVHVELQNNYFMIKHSTISDCEATATHGGGIYFDEKNVGSSVIGCVISNSKATGNGGAIYSYNGMEDFTLGGTSLLNNTASGAGGGMYVAINHPRLRIVDEEGFEQGGIVESEHPYESGFGMVMMSEVISVPAATGFVISFFEDTSVYSLTDALEIWDSSAENVLYYAVGESGLFPGVNMALLTIPGSSFFVKFYAQRNDNSFQFPDKSWGIYGFKLYYTPTFTSTEMPLIAHNNAISDKGGGVFFYDRIEFSIVLSTKFENNYALNDGGAIYYRTSNMGVYISNSKFISNRASRGGAICYFSAHAGALISHSSFNNNTASSMGGAVAFLDSNGKGLWYYSNALNVSKTTFYGNRAAMGGAMYVGSENYVQLHYINVSFCTAYSGNGGGIMVDKNNLLRGYHLIFKENVANYCGGGISSSLENQVTMHELQLHGNIAAISGGGMCLQNETSATFYGTLNIANNSASSGGGIFTSGSPIWNLETSSLILLEQNRANYGSAILFVEVTAGDYVLHNISMSNNVAYSGGTIYWIYDEDLMSEEPGGIWDSSLTWNDNTAQFGAKVGTQALTMIAPLNHEVTVFGASIDPPIVITLEDFYLQVIPGSGHTPVYAYFDNPDPQKCKDQYPYVSGSDTIGGVEMDNKGFVSFENLEIYCAPKGEHAISFEARLGSLLEKIPTIIASRYYVKNHSTLTFRQCGEGEYESDALCLPCGYGTYNVIADSSECEVCTKIEGVDYCESNQISLLPGYWRRYQTNTAVLQCPLDGSCLGGTTVGDMLCKEGYIGPLCSVCADDYFNNGGVCEQCSESNMVNIQLVVFLVIAVIIIGGYLFYFFRDYCNSVDTSLLEDEENISSTRKISVVDVVNQKWEWIKMKYNKVVIKIKIIVSTFQIIIGTAQIFIVELPSSFNRFSDLFSFLDFNVLSLFPIGCSREYDFFATLIMTTVTPIAFSGLLLLGFMTEYFLQKRRIDSTTTTKKMVEELEDKYLNYFFYLTYLVLPSVTVVIFETFICTDLDPYGEDNDENDTFLTADMNISCTSFYYNKIVIYACVMILVYPVGIPVMYFVLLYRHKDEISSRADFVEEENTECKDAKLSPGATRLAFLYEAYEPKFWYWEIIETGRRLTLTAVLSVINPGTSDQTVISILLALVFIKLYSFFQPYEADPDDILAETGQYQIFLTFFFAMVIQNSLLSSSLDTTLGIALIIINLGVVYLGFYYEILDYREELGESSENENDTNEVAGNFMTELCHRVRYCCSSCTRKRKNDQEDKASSSVQMPHWDKS